MQWIAEGHPDLDDWKTNIQQSIDFGAAAACSLVLFVQILVVIVLYLRAIDRG